MSHSLSSSLSSCLSCLPLLICMTAFLRSLLLLIKEDVFLALLARIMYLSSVCLVCSCLSLCFLFVLKKNLNASRPSKHIPVSQGEKEPKCLLGGIIGLKDMHLSLLLCPFLTTISSFAGYFHVRFLLSDFTFFFVRPCSVYLVTTAGFVSDQLIM